MNVEKLSSCTVCLCVKFDGVYNSHAIKLLHELFPDLLTSENIILCRDCSSLLDMYRNIKVLLTDNQKKFKQKESNELNIANFISWSNGESNDLSEDKCHICSKIMYYENLRSMSNGIVLQVFPYLDPKFCSTIKLCYLCMNIMDNLKTFKIRCSKIKTELPKVNSEDSKNSNYTKQIRLLNDSNYKFDSKYFWDETNKIIVIDFEKYFEPHEEWYPNILYRCQICDYENESCDIVQIHGCKANKSPNRPEKIYKCQLCPFKSNQKGNLKTHLLVHKNTEDIHMYKCDQCKFQSRQKGNLKTHLLVHLPKDKVKMYRCSFCSFAARQKGNLKTHLLKKHKIKRKKLFKRHMDEHNNLG